MIRWNNFSHKPIKFLKNGWYFSDETWSEWIGPFHSYIEAAAQLKDYCNTFLSERLNA
jgi:hypothetical protein